MTGEKPKVGFSGIGMLGSAIARRLLDCGFPVAVWNRTPEKTQALVDAGAGRGATPASGGSTRPYRVAHRRSSRAP